ncbi:MAG TPA: hypothetical protein VGM54_25945 [Chthoniobacter sp.]|jgi:hypothetical protein
MSRLPLLLLVLGGVVFVAQAADEPSIKSPSPGKRFALRIGAVSGDGSAEPKVDLIEKESGKVVVDLGTTPPSYVERTSLVWSADGKRVAYGTRGDKEGDVRAFIWNGSAFDEAQLPGTMPDPAIRFDKSAGAVKNYGGAVQPLRWLKSGELELSNDLMMLSRDNGRTYTGTVIFTVAFDAKHQATIHHVGKTKTQVEK